MRLIVNVRNKISYWLPGDASRGFAMRRNKRISDVATPQTPGSVGLWAFIGVAHFTVLPCSSSALHHAHGQSGLAPRRHYPGRWCPRCCGAASVAMQMHGAPGRRRKSRWRSARTRASPGRSRQRRRLCRLTAAMGLGSALYAMLCGAANNSSGRDAFFYLLLHPLGHATPARGGRAWVAPAYVAIGTAAARRARGGTATRIGLCNVLLAFSVGAGSGRARARGARGQSALAVAKDARDWCAISAAPPHE